MLLNLRNQGTNLVLKLTRSGFLLDGSIVCDKFANRPKKRVQPPIAAESLESRPCNLVETQISQKHRQVAKCNVDLCFVDRIRLVQPALLAAVVCHEVARELTSDVFRW